MRINLSSSKLTLCTFSAAVLMSAATLPFAETALAGKRLDVTKTGSVGSIAKGKSRHVDIRPASAALKKGLKAISKKNMKTALRIRGQLPSGSLERKVLAWAIAIDGRNVSAATLSAIASDLATWPGAKTMRKNIERALVKELRSADLRLAFSASAPETEEAAIALAKAHLRAGAKKSARKAIAPLWRNSTLNASTERKVLKHLSSVLTRADHRARVDHLLSRKRIRSAERIAGLAGATRLVKARAAVERKQRSATKALSRVPASQRKDYNYLHSKARLLRRADKVTAAAKALLSVNPKSISANAADKYWQEQRIVASDLLEIGSPKTAYRLAARNVARSSSKRIDAEFFAGWIALRELGDASTASRHFSRILKIATTPLSKSRGHYWLGRALAKSGKKKSATDHFAAAARHDTTFYGQLAAAKLGRKKISIARARPSRSDRARFNRYELVQAIAKLESAGQKRKARTIYRHLARHMRKPGELALLAARAERQRDYQLSLQVGKRATQRGFNAETLAYPLGAIPRNTKTSGAGLPLAYAIARQESTFQVDARSPANALGLLQLLPSTAKRTARSVGVKYSKRRLTTDASYNARLGTAYLDQQMKRFGGSYILTFAAYNAGPLRAAQWVERNGDPRGKPLNTVIDWIEKIPYAETRNYVQRVMENYQVYKTRLKGSALTISRDLRRGRRG